MKTIDIQELTSGWENNSRVLGYFLTNAQQKKAPRLDSRLAVLDHIRQGIPYDTVENILERTSVPRKTLAHILHLSVRQMNRYEKDELLPPEQSGFVYEFSRLYIRGIDVFGDAKTLDNWLGRQQLALGNQVPLELLDTAEGFRMVHDVLAQIEYGFYS